MSQVIRLTDLDDPRLAAYRDLRGDPVDSFVSGCFIVEGRWCVQRLVQSSHEVRSVLVEQGRESAACELVSEGTTVYSLPRDRMRALVGFEFHRGMLACGTRPPMRSAEQLRGTGLPSNLALAVLGVNQRDNLGSMLRSAAALGVVDILIGPKTADPYSRRAVRVSMAAVLKQTLYAIDRPVEQLAYLSDRCGYRTVVTTLGDAIPLDHFVRDERPIVLCVGSEAEGVEPEVERVATDRVTIPMKLGTDSLNVAVATAIFLYELGRR